MKVFVVDDNNLHLKMCRILLQNLGHDVETFESLDQLKEEAKKMVLPDILLIDYRLSPSETGLDVLNFIREMKEWRVVKTIALTADVSERAMLESAGFDQVAFKPITETLLKEIIV